MLRPVLAVCLPFLLLAGEAAPIAAPPPPLALALAPDVATWKPETVKPAERTTERSRITIAGKAFLAAVKAAKDGPSEPAQRAVASFVEALTSDAKPERPDILDPAFARRAARGGALRGLGADSAVGDLEKAVLDSTRMLPVAALTGPDGSRLEDRRDAFGAGGWVLNGARCAYAVPHGVAQFVEMPQLILTVELPPKSDPANDAGKALSAALHAEGTVVATWTAKDGRFQADLSVWRKAVPEPRGRGIAPGLLPPHLVLSDLDGDVVRLIVPGGSLLPTRSRKTAEYERALAETAKVLPDAAHLDLFGQHLFRYVFDSPDPRFPFIIGTPEIKGDIHQTAEQTLSSTTGGQCRGDCDDLAEFYQTVAERQGRFGHLLILPSHTAFAAARKDGEEWVVEVMQTGPTMAFRAATVPEALRAAHANFDPTAPFSPDHLGLLLRFSGENTRGPFGLGWRIFAERDYARTMIDVQRDWQYQTYARAIAKMERMIKAGDRDPANLHELAALYAVTGQWPAACAEYRENLAALEDPVSKIEVQLELAGALRRDGKAAEARTVLAEVAAALPGLAPKLGQGIARLGMQVSLAQLGADDKEGARKTLLATAFGPLAQMTGQILGLVSQPGFDPASWSGDGRYAAIRQILGMYIGCLLAHLDRAGAEAAKDPTLQNARRIVDAWLARIAFLEADSPVDTLPIYATAARIHALDMPAAELAKAVETAAPPTDAKRNHRERKLAPAAESREADLPWIRISPAWWQGEVNRALRGTAAEDEEDTVQRLDPAKIDRARVAAAGAGAAAALATCAKLGLNGQAVEMPAHFAALTAAVVGGDDKTLRERLKYVKRENDKRLRDATAAIIGSLAPACDAKQWQAVLKAWADEVDYKPKWYSIAWTAAVAGAPQQALATARMAATRFKDDASFVEELAFMEKLLAPAKP